VEDPERLTWLQEDESIPARPRPVCRFHDWIGIRRIATGYTAESHIPVCLECWREVWDYGELRVARRYNRRVVFVVRRYSGQHRAES
jgi:hypothetical protein